MLGVAIAMIVVGVVLLFLFPWGGILAGAVGLLLLIAYFFGIGKRAVEDSPRA